MTKRTKILKNNINECLLVIDFGSQVTQLIARRLRELSVYSKIYPFQNINKELLKELSPKAIIFSGGPSIVLDRNSPKISKIIYKLGIPILGICYGQQLLMFQLGGKINSKEKKSEFGRALIEQKRKMVNTNLEMITFYPECKSLENIDNYQEKIFCVEVERRNKEIHNELETNKMEIKSFNFLDQYIQKRIDFYNKNNLIKISIVSKNDNKQRENSSYILSILISLFLTFLITLILFLLNKLRKN